MPENKRNGRTQDQHIQVMSAIRDVIHPNGKWINLDGRPSKENIVKKWRLFNPTGMDPKTIRKWWNTSKKVLGVQND